MWTAIAISDTNGPVAPHKIKILHLLHFFVTLRDLRASREHLCRLRRVVRIKK
jgi:hypothetical protein